MQKLLSILIAMLNAIVIAQLVVVPVWGATIYVKDDPNNSGTKVCYKADGWADATCSDGTGNSYLSAAHTAAGTGGNLIIAAGNYTGTQLRSGALYSKFTTGAAGVTTRAAMTSDPLDNGVSRAGTVILNGNNDAYDILGVIHSGCVFSSLTFSQPASGYSAIIIGNATLPVFNDINFIAGNGTATNAIGFYNCSTDCGATFNRTKLTGYFVITGGSLYGTLVFNYGRLDGMPRATLNGNAIFNNFTITNSPSGVFRSSSNVAAVVTFNNPIFYANVLTPGTGLHVIENAQALPVWTINNGILSNHASIPDTYGYVGVTINNSNRTQFPGFVGYRYPAVLSFASDDNGNIDWYYSTIAPALESRGMRGTMALYGGLTGDQITKALDLQSRGHEIALHGRSHTVCADIYPLFTVLQTGYTCSKPYSGAGVDTLTCTNGVDTDNYDLTTYTVSSLRSQMSSDGYTVGTMTTNYDNVPATVMGYIPAGTSIAAAYILPTMGSPYTLTGAAGETAQLTATQLITSTSKTYTLADYTVSSLRTAMVADGYTVPAVAGGYDGVSASCLSSVPSGTSIASALPLIMSPYCTRESVIRGGYNYLTGLGLNVSTYVPPIDNTSPGLRKYLYDSGLFVGARGDVSGPIALSSINAYYIRDYGYTWLKTTTNCVASGETEANCIKRNTIARISYMKSGGHVGVFLAHNESEFNAAQWTAMLDAVAQSGIQVMTLSQLAQYIKTYDPSGDLATADGMTYTRTLIDQSDYHLRSGSPAINAGVDVGLTTDADGKPIVGLPDIGAYEYQETGIPAGLFIGRRHKHMIQ